MTRAAANPVGSGFRALRWLRARRGFDSRLVWLLGSPRSGSTWLLQLLSEQPAVVPVNEPLIGLYLSPFLSDLPGWEGAALDDRDFTIRHVQADKPDQFFAAEFDDVTIPALGRMLRARFLAHLVRHPCAVSSDRARIVVKEPNGSQSADLLLRATPHSRLLFLLRDGRDVVDSELAANLAGSWVSHEFPGAQGIPDEARLRFVEQSARKWLWRTQAVEQAFKRHAGPKLLLRYEDLLADPEGRLTQTVEWMGLEAPGGQIAATVSRHSFERIPADERGQAKFHRSASPGTWRQTLTEPEQAALDRVLGPKLRELGYEA